MLELEKDYVQMCIDWNKARYEQTHNLLLSIKLLDEEVKELKAADSKVAILDACGDITFVAVGILWKVGMSDENIKEIMYGTNLTTLDEEEALLKIATGYVNLVPLLVSEIPNYEDAIGVFYALNSIFFMVLPAIRDLGLQSKFYDVFGAICFSNATKTVHRVTPDVKANIIKGSNYKAPTEALEAILRSVN